MYTLSDVFLNHAACTRRSSASSFWEAAVWTLQLSMSSASLSLGSSGSVSDSSCMVVANLSVEFCLGELGVVASTGFIGLVGGVSSPDSSESYRVSLPVESSSGTSNMTVLGHVVFL